MTDTMKKLAAGTFAALALCLALIPGIAWADVDPGVTFKQDPDSNKVAVELALPVRAPDDVRALKLTVVIEALDPQAVEAKFDFADELKSEKVQEVRYGLVDGKSSISIYLVSDDNLFAGKTLSLGNISFEADEGTKLGLEVVSFETVNAAHEKIDAGMTLPNVYTVTVAEEGSPNPPTPPAGDDDADKGDGSGTESGTGDGSGTGSGSGNGSGSDGSANRSPGAPSGTDSPLVTTGDNLAMTLAACGMAVAGAGALVVLARCKSQR
ncbi:hypothetical protein [Gordonibacter massiliensis (ex Traore et al. 2017)]|uniref:Gram-positive cocci surface proteins LPxTG domain-containing protein n=1 Tax=Gordonibacter massiliensis (ex Traore et al. 2017) TaxID=1841863 RepID=A0A842JE76_9ACTN|nr:hypothetical protein [Gordonibacter massiliensis (ex Traore et al. 2017)]MBC2889226.1 hypothetical protein [Gordonibacter massiliensis (ex Traore et al. 2017)]